MQQKKRKNYIKTEEFSSSYLDAVKSSASTFTNNTEMDFAISLYFVQNTFDKPIKK